MTRKPRAFRLDDPDLGGARPGEPLRSGSVKITEEPFDAIEAADGTLVPMPERRRAPWGGILLSALSGLLLLGLGLAVEELIADLYRVTPWLAGRRWRWPPWRSSPSSPSSAARCLGRCASARSSVCGKRRATFSR
jgi:uncharacterized membrane protein YcjF (UPF0283 family)